MATIDQRLEAATKKAEQASQIMHDVSNGDINTTVTTESGQVDSLAKWQKDANQIVTDELNAKYVIEESARNDSYTSAESVRNNEYSEAEKARDDYFKQEVGSLEQAVTDASNSATAAAQSASEASRISGLDTLASGVGLLSPRFDTPDFLCSFNDGIEIEHGYGTRNTNGNRVIDYSRASAATSIGKSGQQVTLATDEPAIESSGIALFQSLTNLITYSEDFSKWNKLGGVTVTDGEEDPFGGTNASKVTITSLSSSFAGIYSLSAEQGNTKRSVWIKADESTVIYFENINSDQYKYETEPNKWVRVNVSHNAYFKLYSNNLNGSFLVYGAQAIEEDIPNAPYVPTTGTAVTRAADIAKVTSVNNLPAAGKPWYCVVDVDFGKLVNTGNYRAIIELDNATQLKIELSNSGLFIFRLSNQTLQSDNAISGKTRIICYFNGSEYGFYLNAVKGKSSALSNVSYDFTNINLSKTPALNGHMKNLIIKHSIMTDDLAKAYGEHPDA